MLGVVVVVVSGNYVSYVFGERHLMRLCIGGQGRLPAPECVCVCDCCVHVRFVSVRVRARVQCDNVVCVFVFVKRTVWYFIPSLTVSVRLEARVAITTCSWCSL